MNALVLLQKQEYQLYKVKYTKEYKVFKNNIISGIILRKKPST